MLLRALTLRCLCWLLGTVGLLLAFGMSNIHEFGLLLNTLRLVLLVELFSLPLAMLPAFLIARSHAWGRTLLLPLLGSLLLMPLYLQLCGWDAAFGVLGWFTLAGPTRSEPFLAGFRAAVVIHTVYAIPGAALLMSALFRYGHRDWEEQALLEGDAGQVFRSISLPQLGSGLLLAAVWILVVTAGEMTVTNIYMVRTYAENVYSHFAGSGDLEAVLPQTVPLLAFTISLVLLACAALLHLPANLQREPAYRWPWRGWQAGASILAWLFVGSLALLPLINLAMQAGLHVTAVAGKPERAWSLTKCLEIVLLTPRKFSREFVTSLNLSLSVTFLALPLGGLCAWWTQRHPLRAAGGWLIAAIGIALPAPLIGIAVIRLLNQPESSFLLQLYDRTLVPPVLALLVRCFPVAYLGCWWAWRSLDPETLAAASLEGAGVWRQCFAIALPQRISILSMLALLIFALASGDLSASLLTLPPGMSTIAQRMFGLVHSGVNDQVAGIGIVMWLSYGIAAICICTLGTATRNAGHQTQTRVTASDCSNKPL